MYKYSCRDCPIRERCIDQSETAARVKEMIRAAFAARRDTLTTWGILQKKCLLVLEDEEQERRANQESLLSRRLREAKEQDEILPPDEEPDSRAEPARPAIIPNFPQLTRTTTLSSPWEHEVSQPAPTELPQCQELAEETPTIVESQFERQPGSALWQRRWVPDVGGPCWLIVVGSNRHIALPVTGQLVLGRFDPGLSTPPDVDLTFEDQRFLTVSRLHAKVVGVNGRYSIKDLGSSNGLFLNGEQVTLGLSRQLQPGDRLALGYLQLVYQRMPVALLDASQLAGCRHFLMVAFSGRKLLIESPELDNRQRSQHGRCRARH